MSLSPNDPRHGTRNGYVNYACRCKRCCVANTEAWNDWAHRTGYAQPLDEYKTDRRAAAEARDNHGTETRYGFGCRCDECRAASADARRRRRAAA